MANPHSDAITGSGGSTGTPTSRTRASATLAGVRRNLFQNSGQQHQQQQQHQHPNHIRARRLGQSSTTNSSETLRVDANSGLDGASDPSEIVVRDRHGEIELGEPPAPDLEDDGEMAQDDVQEREQERQRLAEAVKHHQINNTSMPDQPEELLEAVRASLRLKVTALAEDNWMYEPEEHIRGS